MASAFQKLKADELVPLALRGLERLYDEAHGLFGFQFRAGRRVRMHAALSIRYTAISILGLIRARVSGEHETILDEGRILERLVPQIESASGSGDLGLILWADALAEGHNQEVILAAITRRVKADGLTGMPTLELAWLLTGLSYARRWTAQGGDVERLASVLGQALMGSCDRRTGLFSHSVAAGWPGRIRNEIGSFADQVYSVYALATYHESFGYPEGYRLALKCARRLCELQGEMGQWWWHYHARRGVVASRYPVYSVHQDGMAPMALRKVASIEGQEFDGSVDRGLQWLFGANELGVGLVVWGDKVIWRDIEPKFPASNLRYLSVGLSALGVAESARILDLRLGYRVRHEMRPYELGWLLYGLGDSS